MADEGERPWLIGTWGRDAAGVLQSGDQSVVVSADERARLTRAMDLAAELNGNALLTSGQDAANALFAKLDEVAAYGSWLPVDLRASVAAALGAWLGTITASRVALEDAARRYFPDDVEVSSDFKSAHANNASFRLAWELRNALHHEGDVAKYVNYASKLGENADESLVDERIDLTSLLASPHLRESARTALLSLWGPHASPIVEDVVRGATVVPGNIFAALIGRNEASFVDALEVIARTYAAASDGVRAVYLYQVVPKADHKKLTINARPVDASLIGFIALNVDTARRQAGLEPLFGPTTVVT